MLVLEGSDCAGKTTFLKQLIGRLPKQLSMNHPQSVAIQHFGVLPPDWDYYKDYLDMITVDGISDRFQYSELVYGPVLRGHVHPRFDQIRREMVLMELLVTGSLVVYCRPDIKFVEKRYLTKHEGDTVLEVGGETREEKQRLAVERIRKIVSGFDDVKWVVNSKIVKTEGDVDEEVENVIEEWMPLRDRALQHKTSGHQGWGSLKPDVLVIGERPNYHPGFEQKFHLRPFGGPCPHDKDPNVISNSSDWVFTMMREAGTTPNDWHLTNAYQRDGTTTLQDEVEFLNPKRIIVMGNVAKTLVVDELEYNQEMPVLYINHPQYLRRFFNKSMGRFIDVIKNFLRVRSVGLLTYKVR
jgi:hypothetical protein